MRLPPLLITGCALVIAYCASCSLLTDGALSDKPPETAGTGAGGAGQGGEGGAGGMGGACIQVSMPPGDGGNCPAPCESCTNNICVIDCDTDNECEAQILACPADFACEVQCSGNTSCSGATINCPEDYACDITCSDAFSCENAVINCNSSVCGLACESGNQTCEGTQLMCGSKACTATCGNGVTFPDVECDNASACPCNNEC